MATIETAAIVTDSSAAEAEDAAYPCKGCGQILEEGKAFELAGNRWHIDCFRCNTCSTLLDSDANLLLLGDGSLICNNCTYSCSACGNKIEDLAILTGDQAFCANCFKCRNCKRKIENLRYARTSQGIFCMQCHESLMARRRKKSRALAKASPANGTASGGPAVLDKSLPALPAQSSPRRPMSPGADSLASETPLDLSPVTRPLRSRRTGSHRKDLLTSGVEESQDSFILPTTTYSENLRSAIVSQPEPPLSPDEEEEGFMIPIALDPSPALPPLSPSRRSVAGIETVRMGGLSAISGVQNSAQADFHDDFKDLVAGSARSGSRDQSAMRSPHIAYQEMGRSPSAEMADSTILRGLTDTDTMASRPTSPTVSGLQERSTSSERQFFKLSEAPKARPTGSRTTSRNSGNISTLNMITTDGSKSIPVATATSANSESSSSTVDLLQALKRRNSSRLSPLGSPSDAVETPDEMQKRARADSLTKSVTRKEVPKSSSFDIVAELAKKPHRRNASNSSPLILDQFTSGLGKGSSFSADGLPARNSSRQPLTLNDDDGVATPRPPVPLSLGHHRIHDSVSSIQSEGQFQARENNNTPLPPHNASGDLSMDEEMGRIMRGEEANPSGQGLFRRVSKAVKHGRSHSDKINVGSPKWPRSARNGSVEINSPLIQSPVPGDELTQVRSQLKYAQQRVADLEAERLTLQERVNGTVDIRQVNTELREKRSTMAFLDTQREFVVRELEVMTDHLSKAKESNVPLNVETLQNGALKDFSASLHKLKDSLGSQIEELMHKKNELTMEVASLIQVKEKNIQEFENLNAKNTQLAELNNQLVHNVHELYKHAKQPNTASIPALVSPPSSGLGIFANPGRDGSFETRSTTSADHSISQLSGVTEVDRESNYSAAAKAQPAKKFNWKKGAKNVSKGFKGAFGTNTQNSSLREEQFTEGVPYGSLPANEGSGVSNISLPQRGAGPEPRAQTWNFLSAQRAAQQSGRPGQMLQAGSSQLSVVALPAESAVFGSALARRCSFEKRLVPSIVTRCIAEVESRGMPVEGIYRKSGSASQVKAIQAGFERDYITPGYDIADPDLDIHAVTSVLKQYFRRLPLPLITWEVYDGLLEAGTIEGISDDERAAGIRSCVARLPHAHRDTLELLVEHLVRVMERDGENLMTPTNLAVVFAPTIMRPESVEREMSDIQAQRQAVQCLLELSERVFGGGSDGEE